MTPEQFVIELKNEVRRGVAGTIDYLKESSSRRQPEHLATMAKWYNSLSDEDKAVAQMAMEYAAEGSLFTLLNIFDGVMDTPSSINGEFELYHVKDGARVRLNETEGASLYDIFNNTP